MEKAVVFDVQKFSVHDGPGIRTILFLKGCPLRCTWCANPESQSSMQLLMFFPDKCIACGKCIERCKNSAIVNKDGRILFERNKCTNCGECTEVCYAGARKISGKEFTVEDAIKEVDKDKVFYRNSGGGLTFSGGEPMVYPEFVRDVSKHYFEQDISVAIETCGEVPKKNYEMVLPYLNLVLFDLKIMDNEMHKKYTGSSNKQILNNIRYVSERVHTIIRTPIIPGINDSDENIEEMGTFIKSLKGNIEEVHILPYHELGRNKYDALGYKYTLDRGTPSNEHMCEIKEKLEGFGLIVQTGG